MSSKSSSQASDGGNDLEYSDEAVDPRVQVELEKLNSATDEINRLEVDLDDARAKFRQLLCDTTLQVDALGKKLGSCIDRARPYYDARIKAKEALLETQKAAVRFERANSAHTAAKEMVFLAEEGLKAEGRTFDHAWQEMLNHATMRVNESETERTASEMEHRRTSQIYHDAERRVQHLQKELKRSITKSRPYFELKSQYNQQMDNQKQRVKRLENQVAKAKASYAEALRNLEQISDEIHKIRNHEMFGGFTDPLGVRGLGVGAESPHHSKNIRDTPPKSSSSIIQKSHADDLIVKSKDQWQKSAVELPDIEHDEEFMSLPSKLGPSASPIFPKIGGDTPNMSHYLGLSHVSGDVTTRLEAVAKLEKEVLEDAKTNRLEAERRPSLATSTPSCNTTPKKAPSNKFLPINNPFEPLNVVRCNFNDQSGDAGSQTWTAINLAESSSDNSPSPAKSPSSNDKKSANNIDIPYRPLLENSEDKQQDNNGMDVITPLVDERNSNIWFRNSKPNKKFTPTLSEDCEDVWTEVSLHDEPETPTAASLFKKVSFFNSSFSCGRPRNSSTDDERRSSGDSNTPPSSTRGSVSLHGTPLKQRMKLDSSLVNWISRSSATGEEHCTNNLSNQRRSGGPCGPGASVLGSRRQSLDTLLWNVPATERVKDILSHGMMMLNISSLAERRSSESKAIEKPVGTAATLSKVVGSSLEQPMQPSKPLKKVPSPLEKSLTYLNAEDDSASDTDSLHSMDMLTDDQISSFMLEPNLPEVCQDILGTPINELLPGYPAGKT